MSTEDHKVGKITIVNKNDFEFKLTNMTIDKISNDGTKITIDAINSTNLIKR